MRKGDNIPTHAPMLRANDSPRVLPLPLPRQSQLDQRRPPPPQVPLVVIAACITALATHTPLGIPFFAVFLLLL